jgi:beta-glucosidase
MTESPLLDEPLKGEWGFDGVVVSDWFAGRSTVEAGGAGLDLVMPGDHSPWGDSLVQAVRAGTVSESAIDEKVRRLLRLAARVGALNAAAPAAAPPEPMAEPEVAALLRRAAGAGMVLVANPTGVLPLAADALRRVAVIGPHAARARTQGGGSAEVHPAYTVSPLDGLRAALGFRAGRHRREGTDGRAEVTYAPGIRLPEGLLPVAAPLVVGPETGGPGVRVELLDGDGAVLRTDRRRTGAIRYTSGDLPASVAQLRVSVRLRADEAGEWRFGFTGIGVFTLTLDGDTVLDEGAFPEDLDMTTAWADPPVRTVTRPLVLGQEVQLVLTYDVLPGLPATICTLGYERPAWDAEAEVARACSVAAQADVAVVVVGTTERVESEGFDRRSLALPGAQDELVRAVAAANPRTVVVVSSGSPVEMPWREQVAAVLLAWFGGQEMGNALADVLLGVVEPGGRLPTTWPAAESDVPVLETTPTKGQLDYTEGIHIGYRAWLRAGTAPAYPFGHGLGYTTWEYQALAVEGTTARVTVRNTGQRAGREVVQAYLSRPDTAVERPVRWLAGFVVVHAEPGEAVTVDVPLDARSFQHWSVETRSWSTEPGPFRVSVGRCVLDTPLTAPVTAS